MNNPTLEGLIKTYEGQIEFSKRQNTVCVVAADELEILLNAVRQSIPKERLREWQDNEGRKYAEMAFANSESDLKKYDYAMACIDEINRLEQFIGSMEGKGYDIVGNPYPELHDEGCK